MNSGDILSPKPDKISTKQSNFVKQSEIKQELPYRDNLFLPTPVDLSEKPLKLFSED